MNSRLKKTICLAVTTILTGSVIAMSLIRPYDTAAADRYSQMVSIRYASQEELDERRNERDEAMRQASEAAAMVSSLTSQSAELSGELAELNKLDEEQREQYDMIAAQYAAALVAKADALNRYVLAQDELETAQRTFAERLSVMFEYQNKSTLEIILDSDSIAGFFTNLELITLIADADDQAVDQMQIALDNAKLQADTALAEAEELERVAQEKLEELEALEQGIALTQAQLDDINASLANWRDTQNSAASMVSYLDGEISRIQGDIAAEEEARRLEQERAQQEAQASEPDQTEPSESGETTEPSETEGTEATDPTAETGETSETTPEVTATPTPTPVPETTTDPSSVQGNGMLSWPLYVWDYVSSEFGYRYHPIYGDWRGHKGMDIASGFGNTVVAAASGTVVYVEYPCPDQNTGGSGYGNYIIIDHGNGVYTLYGHLRHISVESGAYVSTGTAIGEVGSTGGSSGAHLHFEVREGGAWGTAVNPRLYL